MLLGGNLILLVDNPVDDFVIELKENERIRFIGDPPENALALMGFSAYQVGLYTTVFGSDETEARKIYQQVVEVIGKLTHNEVELPVTPYAGLVWIEQVHSTGFTCGIILGKEGSFSVFHTDVMTSDDAIGALQEIMAEEVREQKEPTILVVTADDWEEVISEEVKT